MTDEQKRIYILVKTYPTISKEYSELVCTAGVLEDGSWIRLYPVPFRKLDFDQKYPKYTWITVSVSRNTNDFRPETYRPDLSSLVVEPRPKKVNWDKRRKIVFNNQKIYTNIQELVCKARDWDSNKLEILKNLSNQMNLFQTPEEIENEFKVVQKVPYKFFYKFEDDAGKQSNMMIEDWEIGMLYFNCLKSSHGNEKEAVSKVRQKYFDEFLARDLHFFLGTT